MKLLLGAIAGVIALILGITALNVGVNLYTEYLWYQSFHALAAFWPQYKWWWTFWLVGTTVSFAWMRWFGLRPWHKLLSKNDPQKGEKERNVITLMRWAGNLLVAIIAAAGFGLWSGSHWNTFLLYLYQTPYGLKDPVFGKEISYYLFSLPWLSSVSNIGYALTLVTMCFIALSWGITRAAQEDQWGSRREENKNEVDKLHLPALMLQIGFFLLIFTYRTTAISIPGLVYTDHGKFYGAGALEAEGVISYWTLYAILTWFTALMAAGMFFLAFLGKMKVKTKVISAAALGTLWLTVWMVPIEGLPLLKWRFSIKPVEITAQESYIKANITMTKEGFGLSAIETKEFKPAHDPAHIQKVLARNSVIVQNVRLWDWRALGKVFQQLQGLRRYYTFNDVDVDRYVLGGTYRQVMIAAREVDPEDIPERSWINEHLQYTHGYGAVVIPVNIVEPGGTPRFFVKDFPPESDYPELKITQPQIYFGEKTHNWVLVNTAIEEIDYPKGGDNVKTKYSGKSGVQISSTARRLAFTWRMGLTLLLTKYVTPDSRIIYDRTITEIVEKIAPFLLYDKDPYPVIANGKLYWIMDALTASSYFPQSRPVRGLNYARNSVKVVIDAYDGTTTFYVFDEKDPFVRAYSKIYPGIFRPKSEMPAALRAHVRFSEDLFQMMAEAYKLYHMENPYTFYNKEDEWRTAQEIFDVDKNQDVLPYYIVEKIHEKGREEMVLMLPFTPQMKDNLIGWLAARIEGEEYGKLLAYQFPKQETVFGTKQIEAKINQHPEISPKITLWNQQGSRALHGNLLVIPIEDVLLYVEPLFIESSASPMPELRGVSVALGDRVEMRETFDDSLRTTLGVLLAAKTGMTQPAPPAAPAMEAKPTVVCQSDVAACLEVLERALRDLKQLVGQPRKN